MHRPIIINNKASAYNPPLFASVSVPPRKIEIVGISGGSRLKIKENEMVELKCIVQEAKPKAQIVWFRENSEFVTGEVCSLCLIHLVLSDSHFFQANH